METENVVSVRRRPVVHWGRLGLMLAMVLIAAGGIAWYNGLFAAPRPKPPANSLMVIVPYRFQGTWVFDDKAAGLVREPFVAGIPEMIDVLVKDIPKADQGFRLTFSAMPFPGHQKELAWLRGDSTGNYYAMKDPPMEGWLCPALFRYYEKAPKMIYMKAEIIQ